MKKLNFHIYAFPNILTPVGKTKLICIETVAWHYMCSSRLFMYGQSPNPNSDFFVNFNKQIQNQKIMDIMQLFHFSTHWDSPSFTYLDQETKNCRKGRQYFISHSGVNIFHCKCRGKSYFLHQNETSDLWTLDGGRPMDLHLPEEGKYKHAKFWKTGGKVTYPASSHLLFLSQENGNKPVNSVWNQIWSPNIWKLWDRPTGVDYTEMCRHRTWHLLNMLRCLVTVSEALKNFPLWESHLAGHP